MSNPTFTETLVDGIIDVAADNGVELSTADVTDIALYTLYSMVTASNNVEVDAVKTELNNVIGDAVKTGEYLFTTLGGITAANDEWIDKVADGGAV